MMSAIQDPLSTIVQRSPVISKETLGSKIFAGSFKKYWCCHCQISKECQPVGLHVIVGDANLYLLNFWQRDCSNKFLDMFCNCRLRPLWFECLPVWSQFPFAAEVCCNCCYSVEGTSCNPDLFGFILRLAIVWMAFGWLKRTLPKNWQHSLETYVGTCRD